MPLDEDDRAQYRHTCCETNTRQRTHWHANLPVLRPMEDWILNKILLQPDAPENAIAEREHREANEFVLNNEQPLALQAARERDSIRHAIETERKRRVNQRARARKKASASG